MTKVSIKLIESKNFRSNLNNNKNLDCDQFGGEASFLLKEIFFHQTTFKVDGEILKVEIV